MLATWIATGVLCIGVTAITVWVTNKAYSKKWEEDSDETRGQV